MTYCISIDWLALFCVYSSKCETPQAPRPFEAAPMCMPRIDAGEQCIGDRYPWRYKFEPYGTRQFARLYRIAVPNDESGYDEFAEVQCSPYSNIIDKNAFIVRFNNRTLYRADFWDMCELFLNEHDLDFVSVSRIDICADFNQFATYDPRQLICDFAAKKLRHVGRGVGALYFNHGVMSDKQTGIRDYGVLYNGLSFGTHSSDTRVYLYNKTFELLTQGDKPWIRDMWTAAGLNHDYVWRLEVSIKGKGCKFKNRKTGDKIVIDTGAAKNSCELTTIYHTFVNKLFAFVNNRKGITNISREPRLELFDAHPVYDRGVIRNKTGASRTEKILIKSLYQLADKYRGADIHDLGATGKEFAYLLANSCDLNTWMAEKVNEWEKPIHK